MFSIRRNCSIKPLRVRPSHRLIVLFLFLISQTSLLADENDLATSHEGLETSHEIDFQHPWEAYSAPFETRLSEQRLRLPSVERIMEMEEAFTRILNRELQEFYSGDRGLFLADIRRGLVGIFRDDDGTIKSYRSLYDEKLYSSYNPEAAVAANEIKDNPSVRIHERITARLLASDSPPKERLVFGKYSSGVQRKTKKAKDLECPVIFLNAPLNVNRGLDLSRFEASLARYIATIQINDGQRALALTLDEQHQVTSGSYAPQIKFFKNFMPNPDYLKTWGRAKYVVADSAHWKLAANSSTLQFLMGVLLTGIFLPDKFHLVPAIANGLFALIICSHSKTYENVVKSKVFAWESLKRLAIALPMGFVVAGINHSPNHLEVLTTAYVWYQLTVLNYGDRVLSTVMGRIPRLRDSVGMNAGTFKVTIGDRVIDTGLPGDSTEREIPAIIRNIPKFIGMLLVSQASVIPSGSFVMLALIPPSLLVNYLWLKKNQDEHPRLKAEYQKQSAMLDIGAKVKRTSAELLESANKAVVAATVATASPVQYSKSIFRDIKRRCQVLLAALR